MHKFIGTRWDKLTMKSSLPVRFDFNFVKKIQEIMIIAISWFCLFCAIRPPSTSPHPIFSGNINVMS